jgi:multiple sugar transport system substrate-binding protein
MVSIPRRLVLKLAGGAFAAPAFARGAFAQAARTRLRMTWWGGADRAKRTQAALEAYQKINTNIQIDTETIGWGDYWTRLATQSSANCAQVVFRSGTVNPNPSIAVRS